MPLATHDDRIVDKININCHLYIVCRKVWLPFKLLLIIMTYLLNKSKMFKVRLTHRLKRKIIKELKSMKITWHWYTLKWLHQYRRHPNRNRFHYIAEDKQYLPIYMDKRYLYIWCWCYVWYQKSNRIYINCNEIRDISNKEIDVIELLKYVNYWYIKVNRLYD